MQHRFAQFRIPDSVPINIYSFIFLKVKNRITYK
jgi:hypothetical protein